MELDIGYKNWEQVTRFQCQHHLLPSKFKKKKKKNNQSVMPTWELLNYPF